VVWGT
jgi:hypothetical protein